MTAQRKSLPSLDVGQGIQTAVNLLDWFEADYDVGGVISRMVLRLDQLAARRGIRFYPQTDCLALRRLVDANLGQGAVMSPNMDIRFSSVTPENTFWLLGLDADGVPATTQSGRYFDWSRTNLAEEVESLRFFYDDPARHIEPGTYCRMPRPAAEQISGPVVHSGTMWVRPDFRGPGKEGIVLSQILGKLVRFLGIARWKPDYVFTFSSLDHHRRGVVRNFGYAHEEFPVEWKLPANDHYRGGLFWMTRKEMEDWATEQLKQPADVASARM